MNFADRSEQGDFEFMLSAVFHYEPAGTIPCGDFAGEKYNAYWWRSCTKDEADLQGTQGYLMAWWDGDKFTCHHTYKNPGDMYR